MASLKFEVTGHLMDEKYKWRNKKLDIYSYKGYNNILLKKVFYESFYNQFLLSIITYTSFASGLTSTNTDYLLNSIKNIKTHLPSLKNAIISEEVQPIWNWDEKKIYAVMSNFFSLGFEYEICEKTAIKITELSENLLSPLKTENEIKIQAQRMVSLLLYLICSGSIKNKLPIYEQLDKYFSDKK